MKARIKGTIFSVVNILFLAAAAEGQVGIEIALKNNTAAEVRTRAQLTKLLQNFDLAKWTFTKTTIIDERSIPHPLLTLHTRHIKDDELLLSTYVHEQLHWFLASRVKETADATQELEALFPTVPVGFPAGGNDRESTYLHLIVCHLENRAMRELAGELKAKQIVDFWSGDHYTWIYKTTVERHHEIFKIVAKHKLAP